MSLHQVIAWICLSHLVIFSCVLLFRKNNSKANRVLAFFMLTFAYGHFNHLLIFYRIADKVWLLNEQVFTAIFLIGPLYLSYVSYMTGITINWKKNLYWHILPVFFLLPYIGSFFFDSPAEKKEFYEQSLITQPFSNTLLLALGTIQVSIYVLWSLKLLKKYNTRIKQEFLYSRVLNLAWLYSLSILLLLICVVIAPVMIFFSDSDAFVLFTFMPIITTLLYLFIFYKSVTSVDLKTEQELIRQHELEKINNDIKNRDIDKSIKRIISLSDNMEEETNVSSDNQKQILMCARELDRNLHKFISELKETDN